MFANHLMLATSSLEKASLNDSLSWSEVRSPPSLWAVTYPEWLDIILAMSARITKLIHW